MLYYSSHNWWVSTDGGGTELQPPLNTFEPGEGGGGELLAQTMGSSITNRKRMFNEIISASCQDSRGTLLFQSRAQTCACVSNFRPLSLSYASAGQRGPLQRAPCEHAYTLHQSGTTLKGHFSWLCKSEEASSTNTREKLEGKRAEIHRPPLTTMADIESL